MPDLVVIEHLTVETIIGVNSWERTIRQTVVFDIELQTDVSTAAETDDLQYALDYKAVADRITEFASTNSFLLIESLAEHTANTVLKEFPVNHLRMKVSKPGALAHAQNVAIIIERTAQEAVR